MAFQQNNTTAPQGNYTSTGQTGYGQGPADRVANAIPGHHTGAPGAVPGSNNPSAHQQHSGVGAHDSSAFGTGSATHHGSNTHASNTLGHNTHGSSNNYDSNNPLTSATHGTHEGGLNQGPADKIANALPGHHTGAPGALPGSNNPSAKDHSSTSHTGAATHGTHSTHNTHGTHGTSSNYDSNNPVTSATHGTHQHGLNQGPADRAANAAPGHHTGAPGAVPGSHNPSAHERREEQSGGGFGAGSAAHTGTHTGSHTGSHTTGAGSHATGSHGTHDPNAKPSMADKIGGKIDVLVGKATHNEQKVVQGEIKQTEGKAGLEAQQGLGGVGSTGAGRI